MHSQSDYNNLSKGVYYHTVLTKYSEEEILEHGEKILNAIEVGYRLGVPVQEVHNRINLERMHPIDPRD